MELDRRDLLAKCVAMGVVTLASKFNPATAAKAWAQSEKKTLSAKDERWACLSFVLHLVELRLLFSIS